MGIKVCWRTRGAFGNSKKPIACNSSNITLQETMLKAFDICDVYL